MTRGLRALKDIRFYTVAIILTQTVTVLAAVLTRRFLGPTQVGVWAFLQVILSYAERSALGTTTAASMEIPLYNGRGDFNRSKRITNAAYSFSIISSSVVSIAIVVYALTKRDAIRIELFYGLLIGAVFVLLQRFNSLTITVIRANKEFEIAGKQMLYSSIINAVLIALLSYRYQLYGFLLAMALSLMFNIAYIWFKAKLKFKFSWDFVEIKSLIKFGLPLMTGGFLITIFETLDRLFITRFMGFETLGQYSIGLMAINYLTTIPNSVGVVTISHLQQHYGEVEDKQSLLKYAQKVDSGYGLLMSIMIGLAWFMVPWLVHLVLPTFIPGIPALKYLILGTFFSALAQGYLQLIYVLRKHLALFWLVPIVAVFSALGYLYLIREGHGITGVAIVASCSAWLYFSLLMMYGSLKVQSASGLMIRYLRSMLLFCYTIILLVGINRFVRIDSQLVEPWIRSVAFLVLMSPIIWRLKASFGKKG